ncbi:MAG: hypothetical protein ACYC8T_12865 [Myxococcaceae bacterium]
MRRHLPRATRAPGAPGRDNEQLLVARISELELRLKLLEARVRNAAAPERPPAGQAAAPKAQARKPRPPKRRPRCPGCMLELPPGKRGDSCVWCGFRFEAVGRAFR